MVRTRRVECSRTTRGTTTRSRPERRRRAASCSSASCFVVRLLLEHARDALELPQQVVPVPAQPHAEAGRLQVAQVGLDRPRDVGVLDLDRDAAIRALDPRAVHLAQRRGREGLGLEVVEDLRGVGAQLAPQVLAQQLEVHRRRLGVQAPQDAGEGPRQDVGPVRQDLPELHHRTS